uniref:tetratricopeptide repeat protein n=4 Tax=Bradyrhizobium TaxID=374 RepID=UPI000576DDA9
LTPSSPRFRHSSFREEFDRHIGHVNSENAALPWDRLGHWAQDDEDWAEAERCFRKAYDLAGGEYGYCLAIALKALERFDESVPLLLEQAQIVQPDAMSWFQLATAYASVGWWREAIDAYERALALDPDYAVAMFDLGGAHWNSGDAATAAEVWAAALERFPDHELSGKLRCNFSFLFSDPAAGQPGDGAR